MRRGINSGLFAMAMKVGSFPVIRELPAEYYPIIGRIMVDWAYLESLLHDSAYAMLRLNRVQGRLAVRSPRANEIVSMIEELMSLQSFKTTVNTKELKKALEKVSKARDALAHGIWVKHEATTTPVLQVISGSFQIEPGETAVKARINPVAMETSPTELKLTIRDIARLTEAVEALKRDVEAQAGPLPERSR
jgi:hypothetical protein